MSGISAGTWHSQGLPPLILYLDFDGVLHHYDVRLDRRNRPVLRGTGTLFEYAQWLELILAPYSTVEIVLSTSWVRTKGFYQSRDRLPHGLRNRVIGATRKSQFELDDELAHWWIHHSSRYDQIVRDVARRKSCEWIALDDDDRGWPEEAREHLVHCDSMNGLGEPGTRKVLEERLSNWSTKLGGAVIEGERENNI